MSYEIIRLYAPSDGRPPEIQQRGLTLEEAQAHCNDPTTRGDGWFDGYRTETRERLKPRSITNMLAGCAGDNYRYNNSAY